MVTVTPESGKPTEPESATEQESEDYPSTSSTMGDLSGFSRVPGTTEASTSPSKESEGPSTVSGTTSSLSPDEDHSMGPVEGIAATETTEASESPEMEVTESTSATTHAGHVASQIGLSTSPGPVDTKIPATTIRPESDEVKGSSKPTLGEMDQETATSTAGMSVSEMSEIPSNVTTVSPSNTETTEGSTESHSQVPTVGSTLASEGISTSTESNIDDSSSPRLPESDMSSNETTYIPSTTTSPEEQRITSISSIIQNVTTENVTTTAKYPVTTSTTVTPSPAPWPYPSSTSTGAPAMSSGACLFDSHVYMSAQQIPRSDPCDFCFCFRGDIICLQQSCPPPIPGCYEEPIPGFCCPRYECPVGSNSTTPSEAPPSYYNNAQFPTNQHQSVGASVGGGGPGCEIQGEYYEAGQIITATSGPCLECRYKSD